MPWLGLTNIYLKIGLCLIALGVASGIWLWATHPWVEPSGGAIGWIARASFLGGIIIYLIGRLSHALQKRKRA